MSIKNKEQILSITDGSYQKYFNDYYEKKHRERKIVKDWLSEFGSKYFFTVTFKFNIDKDERDRQVKSLIRMMSNNYLKKEYKLGKKYLEGFLSIEKDEDRNLHYHMVFYDNPSFYYKRNIKKNFAHIFRDNCRRMKSFNRSTIDVVKGVDTQETYSNYIVTYLNKEYEKCNNFSFTCQFDQYGFS